MFQYLPCRLYGGSLAQISKDLVDRFQEHRVAVGFEIAENFRVRQQPSGADAEDQASVEHVIEHRDARRQARPDGCSAC